MIRLGLKIKDIVGKKYNRLKIIEDLGVRGDNSIRWVKVKCDCGTVKEVRYSSIKYGSTKSCGCLRKELDKKGIGKNGKKVSKERLYYIWYSMRKRCNNKNIDDYKYYGGKGIKVCKEWNNSYLKFKEWAINNGYKSVSNKKCSSDSMSIDRIDPEKNYTPENCQIITLSENTKKRWDKTERNG